MGILLKNQTADTLNPNSLRCFSQFGGTSSDSKLLASLLTQTAAQLDTDFQAIFLDYQSKIAARKSEVASLEKEYCLRDSEKPTDSKAKSDQISDILRITLRLLLCGTVVGKRCFLAS